MLNLRKAILVSTLSFVALVSPTAKAKNIFTTRSSMNNLLSVKFPAKTQQPTASSLLYYGGQVVAEPKVQVVFWGDSVNSTVKSAMSDFYSTFLNSSNMDSLSEYSTHSLKAVDGRVGTEQTIKRGTVIGEATITPTHAGMVILDAEIQNELEVQIEKGVLPMPSENTLYMIHFPKSVQIKMDTMYSCVAFGGYHEGFKSTKYGNIFYGIMPDCSFFGSASLDSITEVSGHELAEAITDPFPTPGESPAFPQAWNDNKGNEIGDLCQNESGTTLVGPKATYAIPLLWSNSRNKCYDGK